MKKYKQLPIFIKAKEITKLCFAISDLISEDYATKITDGIKRDMVIFTANEIRKNGLLIPAKIVGAEAVRFYDIKMENATLIRKSAREIKISCNGFMFSEFSGMDYLNVLRTEIDEFRILFAEWVKTFDTAEYLIDDWGLFNEEGVEYDDPDLYTGEFDTEIDLNFKNEDDFRIDHFFDNDDSDDDNIDDDFDDDDFGDDLPF